MTIYGEKKNQMKMQRRQRNLTSNLRISINLGKKNDFWISRKTARSGVCKLSQIAESTENPHCYKKQSKHAAGVNPAGRVHFNTNKQQGKLKKGK